MVIDKDGLLIIELGSEFQSVIVLGRKENL
jgi:hypothetical protein